MVNPADGRWMQQLKEYDVEHLKSMTTEGHERVDDDEINSWRS